MTGFESPDMRTLSIDLGTATARTAPLVRAVVVKGAVNIKGAMQRDARASTSFKGIAPSIGFDTIERADEFEAEIGPSHGPGEAGNLGNIAYFPNSRGGGGTVRDPLEALQDELPQFEAALSDVLGRAL